MEIHLLEPSKSSMPMARRIVSQHGLLAPTLASAGLEAPAVCMLLNGAPCIGLVAQADSRRAGNVGPEVDELQAAQVAAARVIAEQVRSPTQNPASAVPSLPAPE